MTASSRSGKPDVCVIPARAAACRTGRRRRTTGQPLSTATRGGRVVVVRVHRTRHLRLRPGQAQIGCFRICQVAGEIAGRCRSICSSRVPVWNRAKGQKLLVKIASRFVIGAVPVEPHHGAGACRAVEVPQSPLRTIGPEIFRHRPQIFRRNGLVRRVDGLEPGPPQSLHFGDARGIDKQNAAVRIELCDLLPVLGAGREAMSNSAIAK